MSERFVQSHIRNLPLFDQLTPEQSALIAGAFQIIRYEPGEYLFQQGQPTQGMFLFVSGRAELVRLAADRYSEERLGVVTGGQYINEGALFRPGVESASLRATESSIVLFLSALRLQSLMATNEDLTRNIRGQLSEPEREAAKLLFKGQRDDETIIRVFRRHWWSFVRFTWIAVLMATVLLFVGFVLGGALTLVLGALAFIIPGAVMYYLYSEWLDDALFVTSERVVKIHNNLLSFSNRLNEMPLERVLEVNIEIPGADPLARLFRYGTVTIKTAGESGNVELSMMPNPTEVQKVLFAERDRFKQVVAQRSRSAVRADVERVLGLRNTGGDGQPQQREVEAENNQGFFLFRTHFINQEGEQVYRKHITVWISHIFLPLLLLTAAMALLIVSFTIPNTSSILMLGGALLLLLVGGIWFYIADWDWRNDTFAIGNQTVTITHKRPLWLENKVERISLTQVDNVVSDVSGLFDNLVNRGFVKIFLVGSERPKILEPIGDPQEVHSEISRRMTAVKNQQQIAEAQRERQAIADYLAAYHEALQEQQPQQPPTQQPPPAPIYISQPQQPAPRPPAPPDAPYFNNRPEPRVPPNPPPSPPASGGVRPPNIPRRRSDGG